MAEEKREDPQDREVEEILTDLDAILSDLGSASPEPQAPVNPAAPAASSALPAQPLAKPAAPSASSVLPAQPPAKPAAPSASSVLPAQPPAKPAAPSASSVFPAQPPVKPAAPSASSVFPAQPPAKPAAPAASSALPAQPPAKPAAVENGPALAPPLSPRQTPQSPGNPPREITLEPAVASGEKRADRDAPSAPAAETAARAVPPAPAVPLKAGCKPPDHIPETKMPEKIGKDQIRPVAYIYLEKYAGERDAFIKLLEQTAQTVSKKPLFLRRVLYQPIAEECSPKEVLERVAQAKAVAVLGILEGLSEGKLRELGEAFGGAGIMFRVVNPLDAGKKSVAVDIIVDAMLLPHE